MIKIAILSEHFMGVRMMLAPISGPEWDRIGWEARKPLTPSVKVFKAALPSYLYPNHMSFNQQFVCRTQQLLSKCESGN